MMTMLVLGNDGWSRQADRELRATNERTQAWLEQEESGGVWRRWNAMPATDLRR